MRLLFAAAPRADGCAAAEQLALHALRSGHEVWWSGPIGSLVVRSSDIRVDAATERLGSEVWPEVAPNSAIASTTERQLDPFLSLVRKVAPDLIVGDSDAIWGGIAAEALGVAYATYSAELFRGTPQRRLFLDELIAGPEPGAWARRPPTADIAIEDERRINRLRSRLGLAARTSLGQASGRLHLLFSSREVEFDGAGFSASVHCVGPISAARAVWNRSVAPNEPCAVAVPEADLWGEAQDALRGSRYLPRRTQATGSDAPDAIPFAVFCSGNFGFVQDAIAQGLPVVLSPRSAIQEAIAERVQALDLGRIVDRQALTETLDRIAMDGTIRENLANMALRNRLMPPLDRALRLLEQIAGETDATPAEHAATGGRLPLRPRLVSHAGVTPRPDGGFQVGSYHAIVELDPGPSADAVEYLLAERNSGLGLDDLLAGAADSDALLEVLELLDRRGFIEDATGETADPDSPPRYDAQIALFGHASTGSNRHLRSGGARLQAALAGARVGLVGTRVLGSNLARFLALAGVGALHLADDGKIERSMLDFGAWFDAGDVGRPCVEALGRRLVGLRPDMAIQQSGERNASLTDLDFLVVSSERGHRPDVETVGATCHAVGLAWTSLRHVRWNIEVGPTIVPRQTACFTCFAARRAGALASDPDRRDGLSDLDAGGFQWAIGADLACTEIVKFLTGFGEVASVGHLLVLNPLQSSLSRHPVLRLPNCPRCGRAQTWRNQAAWRDAVIEQSDAADT